MWHHQGRTKIETTVNGSLYLLKAAMRMLHSFLTVNLISKYTIFVNYSKWKSIFIEGCYEYVAFFLDSVNLISKYTIFILEWNISRYFIFTLFIVPFTFR